MAPNAQEWVVTFAWLLSSAVLFIAGGVLPALIWLAGIAPGVLLVYRWGDNPEADPRDPEWKL